MEERNIPTTRLIVINDEWKVSNSKSLRSKGSPSCAPRYIVLEPVQGKRVKLSRGKRPVWTEERTYSEAIQHRFPGVRTRWFLGLVPSFTKSPWIEPTTRVGSFFFVRYFILADPTGNVRPAEKSSNCSRWWSYVSPAEQRSINEGKLTTTRIRIKEIYDSSFWSTLYFAEF